MNGCVFGKYLLLIGVIVLLHFRHQQLLLNFFERNIVVHLRKGFDERTVFCHTVLEDVVAEEARVVQQVQKVVEILLTYHHWGGCQEEGRVGKVHQNFCSLVGLRLTVAHLVCLVAKHHAETLRMLHEIFYQRIGHFVLFRSIFFSLTFTSTNFLIVHDGSHRTSLGIEVVDEFLGGIYNLEC